MAVKRYDLYRASAYDHPEMEEFADGEWVRHEDYAAQEHATNKMAALYEQKVLRCAELEAECERLRGELQALKDGMSRLHITEATQDRS